MTRGTELQTAVFIDLPVNVVVLFLLFVYHQVLKYKIKVFKLFFSRFYTLTLLDCLFVPVGFLQLNFKALPDKLEG